MGWMDALGVGGCQGLNFTIAELSRIYRGAIAEKGNFKIQCHSKHGLTCQRFILSSQTTLLVWFASIIQTGKGVVG